jgi:hypothetical protein
MAFSSSGLATDRSSERDRLGLSTEQRYRERAKEAREKAAAATHETSRQRWLEIANGYEQLAEVPGKTPWHVERVKPKK